jgi:hypothetical protein
MIVVIRSENIIKSDYIEAKTIANTNTTYTPNPIHAHFTLFRL